MARVSQCRKILGLALEGELPSMTLAAMPCPPSEAARAGHSVKLFGQLDSQDVWLGAHTVRASERAPLPMTLFSIWPQMNETQNIHVDGRY